MIRIQNIARTLLVILVQAPSLYAVEGEGTQEREEFEYKLAFEPSQSFQINRFVKTLDRELNDPQIFKELKFPSLFRSRYRVQNELKAFVFKDTYFDTKDQQVLASNDSYRLRYRWNKLSDYARYMLFPFKKEFYPTRCEIQFKRDYSIDTIQGHVTVRESRFEFRNDSEPFIINEDAPPSPWPISEYRGYAITGKYKDYKILPTQTLFSEVSDAKTNLEEAVTVETVRYRTHLNVANNPWGHGPNPDQVFIVTLDLSRWKYPDGEKSNKTILEIEIEVDRNTSLMVDHGSRLPQTGPTSILASARSRLAAKELRKDQMALKRIIERMITASNIGKKLSTDYKYARIMKRKVKS